MDKPASTWPIIIRLLGGLGNQLFQYALGKQLSIIHNRPLKLDVNYYTAAKSDPKLGIRVYGLNHFNIEEKFATAEELAPFRKYLKKDFFSKVRRHLSGVGEYYKRSYIFEPPKNYFVFDQRLLSAPLKSPVYLDGFWQAEKYFLGIEKIIRQEFAFKEVPDTTNQKMLSDISSVDSVAIHIRHGDNATKVAKNHGVLPLEYYQKAIDDLTKTVKNPSFFVFSDDPTWAKENLQLGFPAVFVSHNGDEKNYEDLRLMSACKHHIIGNSTFSWWGAWLGKKTGQLVYAPKRYHMVSNIPTVDLYPQTWKKISW